MSGSFFEESHASHLEVDNGICALRLLLKKIGESIGASNIFSYLCPNYSTLILRIRTKHDKESSQTPMDFHCANRPSMYLYIFFHS